jgi:hypothetical protein
MIGGPSDDLQLGGVDPAYFFLVKNPFSRPMLHGFQATDLLGMMISWVIFPSRMLK